MDSADPSASLADAFVLLNNHLHAGGDRGTALDRLVGLAVTSIPGCDWAAITAWPFGRQPHTLATSHAVAGQVDELQYSLGEGPCLSAAADAEVVHIGDVAVEARWPALLPRVLSDTPVRGVLSFHLVSTPERVALNLYSSTPGAFDAEGLSVAAVFAAHARVLLIHAASTDKAAGLEYALGTSRQIGAAVGILMHAHKITSEQAFEVLSMASSRLNRKLRDIAEEVTDTGTLPRHR